MLELSLTRAAVIACLARAQALNELRVQRAVAFRVSADELLLVGDPRDAQTLLTAAKGTLGAADSGALVVDQSDAFVGLTLRGDAVHEAFARISAVPLPPDRPTFQQGLVAHVPTKILVSDFGLQLLLPSTFAHHIRERILSACADLEPREAPAAPFALVAAAKVGAS